MEIYRRGTNEPYSFLANDTIFPSDHALSFRRNMTYEISQEKTFFIIDTYSNHDN